MKCFRLHTIEKNYVRNYMNANRRLLILGCILLFIFMSDRFFPSSLLGLFIDTGVHSFQYSGGNGQNLYTILIFFVSVLSFLLALYQYRFLTKRSACDLYLSLPIKRERLYFLHYLMGVVVLVLSTFGIYVCSLLIGYGGIPFVQAIVTGAVIEVLGIACFTLLSWIHIKCNTTLDAVIISILYLVLPLLLHAGLRTFINNIEADVFVARSFSSTYNTDIALLLTNFLSPIYLMRNFVSLVYSWDLTPLIQLMTIAAVFFWLLMTCFLYLKGKQAFLQKHSEESEQRTHAKATYPVLIPCFILILLLFFTKKQISFLSTILLFLLYLLLSFFAQRQIKLHKSMMIIYVLLVAGVQSMQLIMVKTSAFGVIQEIPTDTNLRYVMLYINRDKVMLEGDTSYAQEIESYESNLLELDDQIRDFQDTIIQLGASYKGNEIAYPHENYNITFQFYADSSMLNSLYYRSYSIPIEKQAEMEPLIQELVEKKILTSLKANEAQEEEE